MKSTTSAPNTLASLSSSLPVRAMLLALIMLATAGCADAADDAPVEPTATEQEEEPEVIDEPQDEEEVDDEEPEQWVDESAGYLECPGGGFFIGSRCLYVRPEQDTVDPTTGPLVTDALAATNAFRIEEQNCGDGPIGPVAEVEVSLLLVELAQDHADDMAAHKMVDPHFADGRSIHTVAMDAGYSADWLRSNVGGGFETFDDMFMSWADFGSTCANLIFPDATHLGVAQAIDDDGKTYWSMLFGRP